MIHRERRRREVINQVFRWQVVLLAYKKDNGEKICFPTCGVHSNQTPAITILHTDFVSAGLVGGK